MGKGILMYRLVIMDERLWRRDTDRVPKKQLDRIIERIRQLKTWPPPQGLDIKTLQNYSIADFRLRVGDYRVLLNKNDERWEIYLLRVLHRSKLY